MSTANMLYDREHRPHEIQRLESDLRSVLREMLERDPNGLNLILKALNDELKPVLEKQAN